jgi:hypothetical protein
MAEVLPSLALVLVIATLVVAVSATTALAVVALVVVIPVRPVTSCGEPLSMFARLQPAADQDEQLEGIRAAPLFPISGDALDNEHKIGRCS